MKTEALRPVIDAMAEYVGLPAWQHLGELFAPGEWLEGLILQESGGDPKATRYEPQQDVASAADPDKPGVDDGVREDDKSYGLMQVMGYNARAMGCSDFSILFLPLTNLSFGLRILTSNLSATGGDVARALAVYNGGFAGNMDPAALRNQGYVDAVATASARAQLARGAAMVR